jgi:hypothetical protein
MESDLIYRWTEGMQTGGLRINVDFVFLLFIFTFCCLFLILQPPLGLSLLIVEVSKSLTTTHHIR